MEAKILKTEAEYAAALQRVENLMGAAAGTPEAEALDLWSLLVEDFEAREYRIGPPDPIDAVRFRMEQQGLTPRDLESCLGGKSKVSEVLNRKRPLSLAMIRKLHKTLGIPAEVLLRESAPI